MRGPLGNDGFSLVEVLVAMGIIITTMVGATPFFVSALKGTGGSAQRQSAVTLAQQVLDSAVALSTSANTPSLVSGRSLAAVTSLESILGLPNTSVLPNYDATALSTSTPLIPLCTDGESSEPAVSGTNCPTSTTSPAAISGTTYTVRIAIDVCSRQSGGTCSTTGTATKLMYLVTADVSWPKKAGISCTVLTTLTTPTCHLQKQSLIDFGQSDPVFVPNAPYITSVSPAKVTVGVANTVTVTGGNLYSATGTEAVTFPAGFASSVGTVTPASDGTSASFTVTPTCTPQATTGTYTVSTAAKTASFGLSSVASGSGGGTPTVTAAGTITNVSESKTNSGTGGATRSLSIGGSFPYNACTAPTVNYAWATSNGACTAYFLFVCTTYAQVYNYTTVTATAWTATTVTFPAVLPAYTTGCLGFCNSAATYSAPSFQVTTSGVTSAAATLHSFTANTS